MNTSSSCIINALFLVAPQFYTTDATILEGYQNFITLLSPQVNAPILSCNYCTVFAFLLAHYLTIAANPNIGIVDNMAEGKLSIGFNVSPDMQALLLTPYGRSYVDLIRRTVVGSTVTNLPVIFGGIIQGMPTCMGCNSGAGWGSGNAGGWGGCGCGGC